MSSRLLTGKKKREKEKKRLLPNAKNGRRPIVPCEAQCRECPNPGVASSRLKRRLFLVALRALFDSKNELSAAQLRVLCLQHWCVTGAVFEADEEVASVCGELLAECHW